MRGNGWRRIIFRMWSYLRIFIAICFLGLSLILITISFLTVMFALTVAHLAYKGGGLQSRLPEPISVISAVAAELGRNLQSLSNRL